MTPCKYELELSPAAVIAVSTPDRSSTVTIDIFEAWRFLSGSAKLPTEDKRWEANRQYLANQFGTSIEQISESMAREFNEVIVTIGGNLQVQVAKKVNGMLS